MHVECYERLILLLELVQQMEQLVELLRLVLCCTPLVLPLELSRVTFHRIRSLKSEQVLIRKLGSQ